MNMPTENMHRKSKLESWLTLAGTLVLVVSLLVYFLPRETKFGYEYEQGRPWRYNSLIATYDFPIYKTQEEVQSERDSAMKDFHPFFVADAQKARHQIMAFRSDYLNGAYPGVPVSYLNHIEQLLASVYEAGIVNSDELAQMAKDIVPGIKVIDGTEAETHTLSELYSTRSAYEYIVHADTFRYPRRMMARCNINKYLEPNLTVDSVKTRAAREDVLASVSPASGMVQSGQRIIDRGEIISADQFKILQSYEKETLRRNDSSEGMWGIILGQVIFVFSIIILFVIYLNLFRRDYLHSPHTILLLSTLIALFPLLTYIMVDHKFFNVYMLPFAMVPMFVRIFMDSRTAFMAMVSSIILSSFALHSNYEFVVIQSVAGMTAVYALKDLTERSQLMRVALAVFTASSFVMLGFDLSQGIDFHHLDTGMYVSLAVNGVLLLFAYPLLYLIEKLFGFTSSVTLVELSNTNNNVLRRMSKVAQGTFVHSLQVANLAAEVADKIGAKPQLVRTGALYHDIGKMLNPAFFTENQNGMNPHDELTEERSAQIIISHVTEGMRLAEKYHLPKVIRDFIVTHHGCSQTKYFYIQWKNKHPEEEPNEKLFTYPGPNPFTREQAILMMCDAVEATSRSLKNFSEESITELVDRIVDGQVNAGFFKECPITFRDIADAKRVLVESLKTVYHTRIAYPKENKGDKGEVQGPRRSFLFARRNISNYARKD